MGQLPGRTFGEQLGNWHRKVVLLNHDVFVGSAQLAHQSIQEGSAITGAPGQPVDTGALKASWQLGFPDASTAEITTNVEYAPIIEDNLRGVKFRVGGPHGVRLTAQNFDKIVEHVTREVTGNV